MLIGLLSAAGGHAFQPSTQQALTADAILKTIRRVGLLFIQFTFSMATCER
jgi:hypothetical protein